MSIALRPARFIGPRRPPTSLLSELGRDVFCKIITKYVVDPVDHVSLALVSKPDLPFVLNTLVVSTQAATSTTQPLGYSTKALSQIVPRESSTPLATRRQRYHRLYGSKDHERLMARLWSFVGKEMVFCGRNQFTNYISIDFLPEHEQLVECACENSLMRRRSDLLPLENLAAPDWDEEQDPDDLALALQAERDREWHKRYLDAHMAFLRVLSSTLEGFWIHNSVD